MSGPERRKNPRIAMERLAYIQIGPNNGGFVLNVSSGGLSFQSAVPVERNHTLRFSLSAGKRTIDACGELVWTDETGKSGGVRFTTLSSEADEQISSWLKPTPLDRAPSGRPLVTDRMSFPLLTLLVEEDSVASSTAFPVERNTIRTPLLSAQRTLAVRQLGTKPEAGHPSRATVSLPAAPVKRGRFSAGLGIGLFISALGALVLWLCYVHRVEIGETLVRAGERLKAYREASVRPPESAAAAEAPSTNPAETLRAEKANDSQLAPSEPTVQSAGAADKPAKTRPPNGPDSEPADVVVRHFPAAATRLNTAAKQPTTVAPPGIASQAIALPRGNFLVHQINTALLPRVASAASMEPGSLTLQLYFDLGKFKDELLAKGLSDQVAQLGLRTTVLERKVSWRSSYQVLVGPYDNKEEETKLEGQLRSHGYKPRPFQRGSRDFVFGSLLSLNGSRMPLGDITIRWESDVDEAKVQFAQRRDVVATAEGRWIQRPEKYSRDEYVYVKNPDGSKTLLEIHFSGLDRALVFHKSS